MTALTRPPEIQAFIDTTLSVMAGLVTVPEAARALEGIREKVTEVVPPSDRAPRREAACSFLDAALQTAAQDPRLTPVTETFRTAEPLLHWTGMSERRRGENAPAPGSYAEITLLGPGGYEERSDIWLGLSLLAPEVRYPDHNHSPEEVYLALSEGDFWRESSGWFTPGIAGTFYNQPSILHAMRSGPAPLLAIWALRRV